MRRAAAEGGGLMTIAAVKHNVARVAYAGGGLAAYHRAVNSGTLTVVMFHRVLAASDERWGHANRTWTVSAALFAQCLDFFVRHYRVVGFDDVLEGRLPPCALLVTFDDGWADNATYAREALRRRGLPAVVFMLAGSIGDDECRQEPLLRDWNKGRIKEDDCRRAWEAATGSEFRGIAGRPGGIQAFAIDLAGLADSQREKVLRQLELEPERGAMLGGEQLQLMAEAGVSVQSHGVSHVPLALMEDPSRELTVSREKLSAALGGAVIRGLSFPHGSYNARVLSRARAAGYQLLFTSDPVLNTCRGGRALSDVLGRIPIIASEITGAGGILDPSRLARWLFVRPRTALGCGAPRRAGAGAGG